MRSLHEIIAVTHSPSASDRAFIAKAYRFALKIHKGQLRNHSTEPIVRHVTRVAFLLAKLGMGKETIVAGLLHHALWEGLLYEQDIENEFGKTVAFLVEGATRLRAIKFREETRHIESLRKLFVASAKDMRILILKLCDRLDSMRELSHNKAYHRRISQETMEIYAPLARRLGLEGMSQEMEDLTFKYIEPKPYRELKKWLTVRERESSRIVSGFRATLLKHLTRAGMRMVKVDTRPKGIYSIYQKLVVKKNKRDRLGDILDVRVQVSTPEDCYRALGIIHAFTRPLPGHIKDYIAFPKPNGYQSIHTTIFTDSGDIFDVQIRTHRMHERAENGFISELSYHALERRAREAYASWFDQLLQHSHAGKSARYTSPSKRSSPLGRHKTEDVIDFERFTSLKSDFFQDRMFIFDKRGEVVDLPVHASPVDFAYELDTTTANHLSEVRINGKRSSLDAQLHNGDIVELLTKSSSRPTRKWLSYARTAMAKQHIKQSLHARTLSKSVGRA